MKPEQTSTETRDEPEDWLGRAILKRARDYRFESPSMPMRTALELVGIYLSTVYGIQWAEQRAAELAATHDQEGAR